MTKNLESSSAKLLAAAKYIREHGWTQGCAIDHDGRVCMLGGLAQVNGNTPSVFVRLSETLDIGIDWRDVTAWNDTPGRTVEEVLGALERAAGLA